MPMVLTQSPGLPSETENRSRRILPIHWIILALIVGISAWVRFHGLKQNGIIGSDTYQYWDIALMWNEGQYVLNNDPKEYTQYFRPTFYSLNALAVNVFGLQDYAIRARIGIFETINVLLAFGIGFFFFRRNALMGLSLAALYAAIPAGILLSQTELPHSDSATFVYAMFLCYVLANRHVDSESRLFSGKWLFASGVFGGLAATTHGSTTFFGPALVLLITLTIVRARGVSWSRCGKELLSSNGVLTLGFAVPYLVWGAVVGYGYMVQAIKSESSIRADTGLNPASLFWKYLIDGPKESVAPLMVFLFLGSLAYLAVRMLFGKRFSFLALAPAIIVLVFDALFSVVFKSVFHSRLYLPMNLFLVLTFLVAAHDLFSLWREKAAAYLVALAVIPSGYFIFQNGARHVAVYYHGERKGVVRLTYDAIGDRVGPEARLLVTPYIQYLHRPQFRAKPYFGSHVSYLMECGEGTIQDFVVKKSIKFVLISKDVDPRILKSKDQLYANLGICTGISREGYTVERDVEAIRKFLSDAGATPIPMNPKEGELFLLP